MGQINSQQDAIATQSCDNPITVAAQPSAECCALAMQFSACRCDPDVAAIAGAKLPLASYRATEYGCGGKCVPPPVC